MERWAVRVGTAVAVVGAALALVSGYRLADGFHGTTGDITDLQIYLGGAHEILQGRALYSWRGPNGLPFTYPPFAALLFSPLTLLPEAVADRLWVGLILASLVVLGWLVARTQIPQQFRQWRVAVAAITVVLLSRTVFVAGNLIYRKVSLLLLVLCLCEVAAVARRRLGLGSGLAAAVKLTPGLFGVAYLIFDRRRLPTFLAATAICTAVAWAVLPRDSADYFSRALWQTSRVGDDTLIGNVSVSGLVHRALGTGPVSTGLVVVGSILVLAAAWWNARRHWAANPLAAGVIVWGASALVAPISWPHHAASAAVWACLLLLTRRVVPAVVGACALTVSWTWSSTGVALGSFAGPLLFALVALCLVTDARHSHASPQRTSG